MSPPHGRDEQYFENKCRDTTDKKYNPSHMSPQYYKPTNKIKYDKEQ